jgi:hypothetical protein
MRLAVEPSGAADGVAVAAELFAPQAIAQDDDVGETAVRLRVGPAHCCRHA